MGIALETLNYYDNSGGLDLKSSATKIPDSKASLCLNVDYSTDGAVFTRNGSTIINQTAGIPAQMSSAPRTIGLFDYKNSQATEVQIICAGTTIKQNMSAPVNMVTGLNATLPIPDMEFVVTGNAEYLIWGNGIDTNLKFDGTTWTNLSLPRPTAPSGSDDGSGDLVDGDYYYYVSFAVTDSGVVVQESELSPISDVVTIAVDHRIEVTIPVCSETLLTGVTAQCNARLLYRVSPTSNGVAYRVIDSNGDPVIIADNVTTTYDDNIPDDGTIEAEFDNQATPTSHIFELDDFGSLWSVDASRQTDVYVSKAYKPWISPATNFTIFDGGTRCIKRCFSTLIFGTDKSLWVQNGSYEDTDPRKISSNFGILNNRCAVGLSILYVLGTNYKFYSLTPTDFSQDQMRISEPLSYDIDPLVGNISVSQDENLCMVYYANANVAKMVCSASIGVIVNNSFIIYNESQSISRNDTCWQYWNNINASAMCMFTIGGELNLYSGDYNGFLWKLDDSSTNGDGAEVNGVATSGTTTTLTDTEQVWEVNKYVGVVIRGIDGTGEDQVATITGNTIDTITFSPAVTTAFDATSAYTIGGYDSYHFSNWKYLLGSWNTLKQLWFMFMNANATGDYTIKVIFQLDFNQSTSDQIEAFVTLTSGNAIWGDFIWGEAIWGSRSVFQEQFRQGGRFRAVRVGFLTREAGHPFQINGFSLSAQNKKLFFGASA